jgi:putative ABC transport system ATP-binding protein
MNCLKKSVLPKPDRHSHMNFPGGEVQRISVARAMAHSPQILLADEPTANLDTDTGGDLVQLVFNMGREHGCTMIIATHDQEIINLADAFLPLRDSKIEKEDG